MTSTAIRAMFSPVDPYDPTLTVDGLSELFEMQIPPEMDPALDASSLDDLFSERVTFDDDLDDLFEAPAPRPVLTLVKPREEPVERRAEYEEVPVPEPEPIVAAAQASREPEVFVSSIQRAVGDFERFAATFHAFA